MNSLHLPEPDERRCFPVVREFTVAVFVIQDCRVLLHLHRKLSMWLPPGGHIEDSETPDEAAVRETKEETGVDIRLIDTVSDPRLAPPGPRRLCRPIGIQVEEIPPDHEHIDLIYAAVPRETGPQSLNAEIPGLRLGWYSLKDCRRMEVAEEVVRWAEAAFKAVDGFG